MQQSRLSIRTVLAGILGTVGVLLVPITLLAEWTENYVLDTENFVSLYQPLAGQVDFQDYLATELSEAAANAVTDSGVADFAGSTTESIDGFFSRFGVDLGLANATEDWTQQLSEMVGRAVYDESLPALRSPQFSEAWTVALTQVHSQIVAGLQEGMPESQVITLQGGPFVAIVQDYLTDQGFSFAQYLPPLAADAELPLVEVTYVPAWRTFVSLLGEYGQYLPWLTGALLLAAVVLARQPWAALARAGFAAAFTAGLIWLLTPLLGRWVLSDVQMMAGEQSLSRLLWQMGTAPLLSQSILIAAISLVVGVLGLVLHLVFRPS